MPSKGLITLVLSLFSIGSLEAGTETVELRHLPVSKFVEQWVHAAEAAGAEGSVQKVRTSSGVTLNGIKLQIDERKNTLTIHGDEKSIQEIKDLAKALDFAPVVVQLKCIRLRVDLKAGKNAFDLLGEGKGGSPVFPAEEMALETLLQKGKASGRMEIVSNLDAVCASNEEATFTTSRQAGETSQAIVIPLVNSKGEITVSVADTNEKGGATTMLNSKITIPDGAAALIGGLIEKDSAGNSMEFALLLQAGILKDGAEAPKATR
ncbi:MAG: hypothetical protein EOP86_21495 [Verrucomicrobiaceae bacterium]|nr:MAG: hypothetical protein EOP86_21495 [Verrucomicrobiaceae bacterium]